MVLAVVMVSFVKPLAFSRYFVVLVPAVGALAGCGDRGAVVQPRWVDGPWP